MFGAAFPRGEGIILPTFVYSECFVATIGRHEKLRDMEILHVKNQGDARRWVEDARPAGAAMLVGCGGVECKCLGVWLTRVVAQG